MMFDNIYGCILGCAIGDALGLPLEGLSKRRQRKLFKKLTKYHMVLGKGLCSDDTDHICFTAEALIESAGDEKRFRKVLAKKFKLWVLTLPAGIGKATLVSGLKLLIGFPVEKAGVFSAGNGPAMRSPIIGVSYGADIEKMKELVKISTKMTHSDPKAELGAQIVAYAAYLNTQNNNIDPVQFIKDCQDHFIEKEDDIFKLLKKIPDSLNNKDSTEKYAESIGLSKGVTGYINYTVAVVIYCWLNNSNSPQKALEEVIRCGGDTDTTAAILGAIIGAKIGPEGFPPEWRNNLIEWPRTVVWMKNLSQSFEISLRQKKAVNYTKVPFLMNLLRNLCFIVIIFAHLVRRMLPPY